MTGDQRGGDSPADAIVDRLLQEYEQRVARGEAITPEDFIRQYADHQASLRDYFDDDAMIDQAIQEATTDWRTAETLSELPPRVAGFEILCSLRAGGMGVVYRARQISLDREVALKTLAIPKVPRQMLKRFQVESTAVARLQHPGVVQIFEVGDFEGRPFFAMELMEGGNLEERIRKQAYSPEDAAELVECLALAVHYSHSRGVLHRDLKPSNVLFGKDGTAKVSDFGLAKFLDADDSRFRDLTHSDAILGTPEYMAPEQARGTSREIGPATDVYGLGAILYRLLAGRPPFQGRHSIETLRLVQAGKVVRPSRYNAKVSSGLEAICLKCLSAEISGRYQSAEELARDIQTWRAGETPLASRAVRRRRLQAAGIAVVIVAAGAYASQALFPDFEPGSINSSAPISATVATTPFEIILFPAEEENARWRVLPSRDGLEVSSQDITLLGLGYADAGVFTIELDISPNPPDREWHPSGGGFGVFYAYRGSDGKSGVYRTIELNRLRQDHNRFLLRHRDWEFAEHHAGGAIGSSEVVTGPSGHLSVECVAEAPPRVFWNKVKVDWIDGPTRLEGSAEGKFGVYNLANSATFSNLRINGKPFRANP